MPLRRRRGNVTYFSATVGDRLACCRIDLIEWQAEGHRGFRWRQRQPDQPVQVLANLAPPPLQKLYSWAPDKQTNLTRGLRAGMLGSEPLRLIDLSIGGVSVAAPRK